MKNVKKFMALVVAIVMTFAMIVTAFAEETKSYSYEAYQIFSGTVTDSGELTGIAWGNGVNVSNLVTALQNDDTLKADFAQASSATDVAAILEGYSTDSEKMKAFAEVVADNLSTTKTSGTNSVTLKAAGYYLIKDAEKVEGNDASTRYIVKALTAETITPTRKSAVPTVEKKVKENSNNTYGDVADYNIGDEVPFKITGTLPSNYDDYTTYYYQFKDSYSANQFELIAGSVNVTIGDTATDAFDVVENTDKNGFTVTCTNLKNTNATSSSKIVVEYSLKLKLILSILIDTLYSRILWFMLQAEENRSISVA